MYREKEQGHLRSWDFLLLDIAAMYISYVLVFLYRGASAALFWEELNITVLTFYFIGNIFSVLLLENYKDIRQRGCWKEFFATFSHVALTTASVIVGLYMMKLGGAQSRLQIFITACVYVVMSFGFRLVYKRYIRTHISTEAASLLLFTTYQEAKRAIRNITKTEARSAYWIVGIVILDRDMQGEEICGIPVVANRDNALDYARREWVDEVLFDIAEDYARPDNDMINSFLTMGITTHTKLYSQADDFEWKRTVEKIGDSMVFTRSVQMVTPRQALLKRVLDITGGVIGCVLCVLVAVVIGPIIYINSPGPIIYASTRIGKNGKKFRFYKFRSMYLDADARKAEFMAQNRVKDGMMFKLNWDPRIIGNKELPDGTRKTGIGEFIRKTSLDEFPQFWNVLKGDMSLVGTRPPTEDEWEKYGPHHRARMAVKPGITGMWQVSGRSEITDFEEVVKLDCTYISNWTIGLDLKILIQTVSAVLQRKGSM